MVRNSLAMGMASLSMVQRRVMVRQGLVMVRRAMRLKVMVPRVMGLPSKGMECLRSSRRRDRRSGVSTVRA